MPPYWYAMGEQGESPEDMGLRAARAVEDKILEIGPDNVAAFVGEPIQGAGGVIVPPDNYWPEIQRTCRKYDVLLVCDEVITGFGRTGEWFGAEKFNIEADFMTIAKGLSSAYAPISGILMTDEVYGVLSEGGVIPHGYTYSGHPVSAAVALENLRIMKEEGLIERVREDTGPYFQKRLRDLEDHPLVGEVRGVGLIAAIELVKDKTTRELFDPMGTVGSLCHENMYDEGVIFRAMRDVLCTSPPLSITREEIDELVDRARAGIDRTASELEMV